MPVTEAEIDAAGDHLGLGDGVVGRADVRRALEAAERAREGKKRGTRLPEDWYPYGEDWDFAAGRGLPPVAIEDQILAFRNYWTSKTGKDATKLNWSRTWQNWILNARRPHGQTALPPANSLNASKDRWRETQRELGRRLADECWDQSPCNKPRQPDVLVPAPAGPLRSGCVSDSGGHDFFNIPPRSDGDGG